MTTIVSLWTQLQLLSRKLELLSPDDRPFVEEAILRCHGKRTTTCLNDVEAERLDTIYRELYP